MLYNTGVRVSEIIDLRVKNLLVARPPGDVEDVTSLLVLLHMGTTESTSVVEPARERLRVLDLNDNNGVMGRGGITHVDYVAHGDSTFGQISWNR